MSTAVRTAQSPVQPTPTAPQRGVPPAIAVLGVVAFLGLLVASSASDLVGQGVAITAGAATLTLLGVFGALLTARGPLLEALAAGRLAPWMMLWFAVAFGLGSLYWIGGPPVSAPAFLDQGQILGAMRVALVGVLALLAGYLTLLARRTSSRARRRSLFGRWTPRHVVRDGWLLFTVGMAAIVAQAASGAFGYLQSSSVLTEASPIANLLNLVSDFAFLGLFMLSVAVAERFSSVRVLSLIVATSLAMGVFAVSGVKEEVALVGIAVLFGYAAQRGRLPLAGLGIGVLAFVFIVSPFANAYRDSVNITPQARLGPATALGQVLPALGTVLEHLGAQQAPGASIGERVARINDVAVVTANTPSKIPDRSVDELLAAPVLGIVPRALWPGKPILSTGHDFAVQYYGVASDIFTAAAITPYGDLWRHGGWLPLIVGMAAFGAVLRRFDDHMSSSIDPRHYFLVVLLFGPIVKQETDVVVLVASIPGFLLAAWVAARLISQRGDS